MTFTAHAKLHRRRRHLPCDQLARVAAERGGRQGVRLASLLGRGAFRLGLEGGLDVGHRGTLLVVDTVSLFRLGTALSGCALRWHRSGSKSCLVRRRARATVSPM